MLTLSTKDNQALGGFAPSAPQILRITTNPEYVSALRETSALLLNDGALTFPEGFSTILVRSSHRRADDLSFQAIRISDDLNYLQDGDVIRLQPDLRISSLYRRSARSHAMLVTERCNSFCLMCSQPPRKIDDSYRVADWLKAIPLFDRGATEVGITGGEPTLIGEGFFEIIRALKSHLPETAVHVLSNGRNFKELRLAARVAELHHSDLMIGIPLYSDIASIHDYVVQADGAFDETITGILNLKRCGVKVEIRVVIHKATYERLPDLARFIVRNLQFVDQVVLMGLEITGFTKANLEELWIDPVDYQVQLAKAAFSLKTGGVKVKIYNHQLCLLDRSLWPFAVQSISEWKNEYLNECSGCDLRRDCGGFFSSARLRYSQHITPIRLLQTAVA